MDEETHRKYDLIIRFFAVVASIGLVVVAIFQYGWSKERESKSHYWELQITECERGMDFATQIVLDSQGSLDRAMIEELYKLSYGKFRLYFEDEPLDTIVEIMQRASSCEHEYDNDRCSHSYFNSRALLFAQQCRDMISESWGISLDEIRNRDQWIFPK